MTQKRLHSGPLLILTSVLGLNLIFTSTALAFDLDLLMAQVGETLDSEYFTFDVGVVTDDAITGSVTQRWIRGGANYFFGRVIGLMAGVIGGLSVLMMTYGGFLILTSAGSDQYDKGVDYIKYSAIGLAVVLSAYIIVNAVQLLIQSIYA